MAHISYQPTGMWAYLYLTCIATSNIALGARYPGSPGSPCICTPQSEHPRGHAHRQGRELMHMQRGLQITKTMNITLKKC